MRALLCRKRDSSPQDAVTSSTFFALEQADGHGLFYRMGIDQYIHRTFRQASGDFTCTYERVSHVKVASLADSAVTIAVR